MGQAALKYAIAVVHFNVRDPKVLSLFGMQIPIPNKILFQGRRTGPTQSVVCLRFFPFLWLHWFKRFNHSKRFGNNRSTSPQNNLSVRPPGTPTGGPLPSSVPLICNTLEPSCSTRNSYRGCILVLEKALKCFT